MLKPILGFLAGVVLTTLVAVIIVNSKLQAQNEKLISDQSTILLDQRQIQSLTTDRDACKSKFERSTILYDVGLLNVESRAWVIPVDVEPQAAGGKRGTFTHYDPKTQTETVHFNPSGGDGAGKSKKR